MLAAMYSFFNVTAKPDHEAQVSIEKSKKAADTTCRHCGHIGMDYDNGRAVCPRCKRTEAVKK